MMKRAYDGTYHRFSHKHLRRYVDEFTGRHIIREMDTEDQMALVVIAMTGKRLRYQDLIAGNGLHSNARPNDGVRALPSRGPFPLGCQWSR